MKVSIRRWLSLAILPAAFAAVLASSPAQAADYTGDCASVPSSVSGNISITESGACNISHSISATGYISVVSTGGSITAKDMSAAYHINIKTSSGSIDVENLTANTADSVGNIRIEATGNVKTKTISTAGSSGTGGVEIHANTDGTSSPFIVGGTGNSNGVNGTINVTSATGGGTLTNWVYGGVYITNGDESSTGGITLTNMTDLQVSRSASRSGLIFLDAQDGTLTLPSGTLQSNGASSHGAGDILLLADTIAFGNDTTVSATQTGSSYGTDHGVSIAAENITFGGTTKGLEILADGDGNSQYEKGYVYILPKGSITITNSGDFQSMAWYKSYPNFYYDSGVVNLNGGTSAKLKVTANGDHTEVVVSGREMNFSGGTVDIQGRGATDHKVDIAYYGTQSPSAGLAFGGTGNVNIDANGESGDAGTVYIYVGDAQFDAPNVNIKAQGPTSGNGDGGRITFISTDLALNSSSKLSLNSDAASNGTGEALFSDITAYDPKAIEFFPGSVNLKLGYDNGEIALSARGGSQGGNAGAIALSGSGIQFYDNDAVKINAQDGDSNGGGLVAYTYFTGIDSSVTSAVIDASGHGSGIGGRVFAYHSISKFDVSKYIKVDGGDTLKGTDEGDFGQITLNAVSCQQRTTDNSVFPKMYWNCVNTDTSTSLDKAAEDAASSSLSSRTGTDRIKLHVFNTLSDYSYYFAYYDWANRAGETWEATGTTPNIYSSVWENNPVNGYTFTSNTLKETSIHEVGHAFDHLIGQSSQSGGSAYDAYAQNDFLHLDYAVVASTKAASTARPPCVDYGIEIAPFKNAIDVNDEYICHGATKTVPGTTLNSSYTSLTYNHEILQHVNTGQYWFTKHSATWNELYAQALAYNAFAGPNGTFAYSVPDNLFANNKFECSFNWAGRVKQGFDSGNGGTSCTAATPSWYSF